MEAKVRGSDRSRRKSFLPAIGLCAMTYFVVGLSLVRAQAQSLDVAQFSGSTVGEKLSLAQQACQAGIPCVLTLKPELAGLPAGSLPQRCATCAWFDYRTTPPSYDLGPFAKSVISQHSVVSDSVGRGVGDGGEIAIASASASPMQGYLVSNWNFSNTDVYARSGGGSSLIIFGIEKSPDEGIGPGEMALNVAPAGTAGQHIPWIRRLQLYVNNPAYDVFASNVLGAYIVKCVQGGSCIQATGGPGVSAGIGFGPNGEPPGTLIAGAGATDALVRGTHVGDLVLRTNNQKIMLSLDGGASAAATFSPNRLAVTGRVSASAVFNAPLSTPATSTAACTSGDLWADANYLYVCTRTNRIKRVALSEF